MPAYDSTAVEFEALLLAPVLDTGSLQVRHDRLLELRVAVPGIGHGVRVDRAGLVDRAAGERERTVRRQALDRERPRNPNLLACPRPACRRAISEIRVPTDRRVDLVAAHALTDVRVVRNRLRG